MRAKNALGIILSDRHDVSLGTLTDHRTLSAVHFGGRYRFVDFALSNMVNSGILDVGIITQSNYRSLMEHIGSGRDWDLSRKKGGLTILPPFVGEEKNTTTRGTIDVLYSAMGFMERSDCKYVVLTSADVIGVMDYQEVIKSHIKNNADLTVCYRKANSTDELDRGAVTFVTDDDGTVLETIRGNYGNCTTKQFLGISVVERTHLIDLVKEMHSSNKLSFIQNILQSPPHKLKIVAHKQKGYTSKINSLDTYFSASMDLLDPSIRREIFRSSMPVFTKVRDEVPAKYGIGAKSINSIVADGAIIDGSIENCVIFRGVRVAKGAVVKDSIIMQSTIIGEGAKLSYIIADRDCNISAGRVLAGYKSYPVVISKESIV